MSTRKSSVSGQEPSPWLWDFDGACVPGPRGIAYGIGTFSVGIFQWLPSKDGKHLKRGKVAERVKGAQTEAAAVYEQARIICAHRNERREGYPQEGEE